MDRQIYMRKFFLDTYGDDTMYDDYMNNRIIVNHELFSKWYSEMSRKSYLFFDAINGINRPNRREYVFESSLSEELAVSKRIFGKKEIEIVSSALPKIEEKTLGNESFHYLSNGCYETTLDNIYKVLNNGSFTVGICSEKRTEEYRNVVKYYNILKDFLLRQGFVASSFESNINSKYKAYVLMYDSFKQKRNRSR